MTVRSRLLLWLLPTLIGFLLLIASFFYFNWSLLLGAFITLLLVLFIVFLIADRISKPIQQLNKAALDIAAGDYETNIQVDGPKEVVELAHTLNTMSQCLVENMSRLRESSLIRERMVGEYECGLLLQDYMLQKVVEDFNHPFIRFKLINLSPMPLQRGLLFKIERSGPAIKMLLLEAEEQGFSGLFHLNQAANLPVEKLKEKSFIACELFLQEAQLTYQTHHLFSPLVWSIKSQQFIRGNNFTIPLENEDMIFLYNSAFIEQFETEEQIENWLGRVLRHFAEDGLETIQTMLTNELNFLVKKQTVKRYFQMISLQIKIIDTHL